MHQPHLVDMPPAVGWRESLARNRADTAIDIIGGSLEHALVMIESLGDLPEDIHRPVMEKLHVALDAIASAEQTLRRA